jgi:glucose/mannose-6-phosphate isomerase
MLDDLKFIAQRDSQDALGVMEKQPQQLLYNFTYVPTRSHRFQNIVVQGMGGSALGAQLALNWPKPRVPMVINRNYTVPAFVNEHTLAIVSSHSGNTEETLAGLEELQQRKAHIVALSSGGKLEDMATKNNLAFMKQPSGMQPRMAVWYNFRALLDVLNTHKLIDDPVAELEAASTFVSKELQEWLPTVPTVRNKAKQLAEEIAGKTAIIYGGPSLSAAAYKWKININENAKNLAFWNTVPESNHNELIGWTSHPVEKPFAVINLISSCDPKSIARRFEAADKLLSGRMPQAHTINAQGETHLQQLLWTIQLGDFVSLYLALINNVDPTPVDAVEQFKKRL